MSLLTVLLALSFQTNIVRADSAEVSVPDTTRPISREFGVRLHSGFIIPHSEDLVGVSTTKPLGVEVNYGRAVLSRAAWARCNCFARTGVYAHFFDYRRADVLGQAFGAGGYFEPMLLRDSRVWASARVQGGLLYLNRVYNAETNPTNLFFSMPVSGFMAMGLTAGVHLTPRLSLTASATYNHISNGGLRLPNKGMNFPTLAVGLSYQPRPQPWPDARQWRDAPLRPDERWTGRVATFGTVRVLPVGEEGQPGGSYPLLGVVATGGYRVSRRHAFTAGLEGVYDPYVRAARAQDTIQTTARQASVLLGYELTTGRYVFTLHFARPMSIQPGWAPFSQRYQLLYRVNRRLVAGVGLRAVANVAEGIDLRVGYQF